MISNNTGKNIIGILGSGFGLYGYLPAVASNRNISIVLSEKYRHKFDVRPELAGFKENITWADETTMFNQINTLIVCLSPEDQFSSVIRALTYPNIRYLSLEKPLAINPLKSNELLNELIKSGKYYRIGYSFQYTAWGKKLLNIFSDSSPHKIRIDWHFLAHHYAQNLKNWKRYNSTGGGIIRFYGIHLIALLAHTRLCKILSSTVTCYLDDEICKWRAVFEVNSIHTIEIDLDSTVFLKEFVVKAERKAGSNNRKFEINMNDPFDEYMLLSDPQDRRVNAVKPIFDSLMEDDQQYYWNDIYKGVNLLWEQIEAASISLA